MKLAEPLTCFIDKNKKICIFKLKGYNDFYQYCGKMYGFIMTNEFNEKDYITLTEEDVIPFIIYHNWCINNIINSYENNGFAHAAKNAYIKNVIETNLTIEDIAKEACNGIDPLVLQIKLDIVIYNYLIDHYLQKYNIP